MKTLFSVVAFSILLAGAAPAQAQRQLPKWEPVVESNSFWSLLEFTDEAGLRHSVYCYYKSCRFENDATQANLYEFTMIDSKPIQNGSLHHYSTKLSPYVLSRGPATGFWKKEYKQWQVTKPGTAGFSAPVHFPATIGPMNLKYVVMAPTVMAPDGTQLKAEKEASAKAAAEKERLAKEAAAKAAAEKERLAKEAAAKAAAEKERLAKEAAARDEAARQAAERERQARETKPSPVSAPDQAASKDLTPFEIVVLKAGATDAEKAAIDKALTTKGTPEYDRFVATSKEQVMNKVKAYVAPSWSPKNPGAAKVWDRFDAMEQDYINERLKDLGPNAKTTFDKQLEAAAKDPKKAEALVATYRGLIKEEFNLYAGAQASGLTAKQQLERMQGIMAKLDGVTNIDEARQIVDDATHGKGSDTALDKKPAGAEGAANEQLPPKGDVANKPAGKGKQITVPKPGADGGEDAEGAKTDTGLWVKRIGSTALLGAAFAIMGGIFGAPLLFGLLGIGLGILYNYQQDA
ncbi:MAG: hypothetical protein HY924_03135 [Elusimicrobia bacterium]|nr:hypothetical protein [Elusimicrobiota bacterium]